MTDRCRSCQAVDVHWATMAVSGAKVLLQQAECAPRERGALFLVDGRWAYSAKQIAERLAAKEQVSNSRALELAVARYPAHLTHWTACPSAEQHRRTG